MFGRYWFVWAYQTNSSQWSLNINECSQINKSSNNYWEGRKPISSRDALDPSDALDHSDASAW